ncbi:MAG: hypothetical protein HYY25_17140 [Candidatus Wallbacteria bacterium]|nr:hypothetical protein [Candidatus Wallbacteria bacterium]
MDLRLEPGKAKGVSPVKSWTSQNKGPIAERVAFFQALESAIRVPGAKTVLERDSLDKGGRPANYRVEYPGRFLDELEASMRPYVLLEVGVARVTPFVPRAITSLIHQSLEKVETLATYSDNRLSSEADRASANGSRCCLHLDWQGEAGGGDAIACRDRANVLGRETLSRSRL